MNENQFAICRHISSSPVSFAISELTKASMSKALAASPEIPMVITPAATLDMLFRKFLLSAPIIIDVEEEGAVHREDTEGVAVKACAPFSAKRMDDAARRRLRREFIVDARVL